MKRPLQLSLAIALALSGTDALALGLGTIHVNSKLNQPLDAEIPVLQEGAGEAEGLVVQLAGAEDFDRVGLSRSRLSVPLEFSLVKGSHGDLVVKVTSKEVVREPFIDFLVEANWPKGRLLREYTVLLDPPIMAPATGTAVTTAAKTPERTTTQALPESRPKPPSKPKPAPIAAAPRSEAAPSKPSTPAAPRHAVSGNEYTVQAGDTLSGIAREVRADESTNINQLMLALLKQNPSAFFKDNINALKRGAILRIPSADEIKSVGSMSEAAAQVRAQIEDWQGSAAAKPTLVAETGTKPEISTKPEARKASAKPSTTSTAASAAPKGNERLELVPPKAGKGNVAMADRPGGGTGGAATSELKSELARTKEALASREQENDELKSRVKDLEDTKSKSDRLISLKDAELHDLQQKLSELQKQEAKPGAKPATPPPPTPATTAESSTKPPATAPASGKEEKVSKEDIWGTGAATGEAKAPAAGTPATTPPSGTASTATPAATTPPPASTETAASTPPAGSATTPAPMAPSEGATTSTAMNNTPAPPPPSEERLPAPPNAPPIERKSAAPAKAPPAAKPAPVVPKPAPELAWYDASWVKPAAIGGAALLVLLALLGLRKRKASVATERGSIAGAFGESPLRGDGGGAAIDSEEAALREQLVHDPDNAGLHLELLSLLYAERKGEEFEEAAESMHAHIVDPHQPEWLEVKAMGQELAPHNPLFSDETAAHDEFDDEAVTASHDAPMLDHDEVFRPHPPVAEAAPADTTFDFDLGGDAESPAPESPAAAESEATFSFDSLPPMDFAREAQHEAEATVAPAPLHVDEDEFPAEDGVGTKLDLAKAYLDMGDPEGARSMLEEVLAEGNDVQKGEARRLMGEIR
jgi:pilus assembly protein FimV